MTCVTGYIFMLNYVYQLELIIMEGKTPTFRPQIQYTFLEGGGGIGGM
jgi:hypothetical protein